MKYKILSWNVAGLRACIKKGFEQWLEKEKPHILCIQESKVLPEQLPPEFLENKKYDIYFAPAVKKGYSGVMTFVKKGLTNPKNIIGMGVEEFDNEGRTLISEFEDFVLFNCYFPNGQRDHARVPYKMSYCDEISKQVKKYKKKTGKPVIVTGDFNTAHHPIDLANPKTNKKSTGFLLEERAWLDQFEKESMVDIFRHHHPEEEGHYTWWTYRGDCRDRNIGWRIDYYYAHKELLDNVKKVYHQNMVKGSDHCPLGLELSF